MHGYMYPIKQPKCLTHQHDLFKFPKLRPLVAKALRNKMAGFSQSVPIMTKDDISQKPEWTRF